MKNVKAKTVRLRNKYTRDIVFCDDYDNVAKDLSKSIDFIRVYTEKDPSRTYLANKEAFDILPDGVVKP